MLHFTKLVGLFIVMSLTGLANGQQHLDNCVPLDTKPEPKVQKYAFKNCILAQFAGYFSILPGNKYIPFENGTVDQFQSQCGNQTIPGSTQNLVVTSKCGNIKFVFNSNHSSPTLVESISGTYVSSNSTIGFSNSTPTFNTPSPGYYYKCDAEQTITFPNASLTLMNVALEPFRNDSSLDFHKLPEECNQDSQPVSNLVRIGVGVCLLALVAIVVIAYFVGRRRWSERSTYESV